MTQIGNAGMEWNEASYMLYLCIYGCEKRKLQRRGVDANWIPLT